MEEKNKKVRKTGMIEPITATEKRNSVGGHKLLMNYLQNQSILFKNIELAKKENVDIPKGSY